MVGFFLVFQSLGGSLRSLYWADPEGHTNAEGTFTGTLVNVRDLDGPNRQSPIASVQRTQSTLASHSAIPRGTNVKRTNANRAIRIAAQRTQGL